jgi:MFS family permease
MATGMAIMGFGGGAFVAGYLNVYLIAHIGVARTVMALGAVYLMVMLSGARLLRRPPHGWRPPEWQGAAARTRANRVVSLTRNEAIRTPQFYLLWGMLFINVTAGIGILAQASPMTQDMFHRTPEQAAIVVSLISLFNAGGRFLWASASDYIGRRNTYLVFFITQLVLFLLIPGLAAQARWLTFQVALFTVFTMYGGGFATVPAFLADIFGTENVGAIHGALLTAWSAAAVAGPVIITELSQRAKAALPAGADRIHIYDTPLQVLALLLAVGFALTLMVKPLPFATKANPAVEPLPRRA